LIIIDVLVFTTSAEPDVNIWTLRPSSLTELPAGTLAGDLDRSEVVPTLVDGVFDPWTR
jgi:hypothetical protein